MTSAEYHRPRTLAGALQLSRQLHGARFIAGGTDLLVQMRAGTCRPAALISLRSIPELASVTVDDTGARIGAAVPLAALLADTDLCERFAVLAQAMARVGSAQIRSSATIGGNLVNASPVADTAPPLIALGAPVCIAGQDGVRELPLESFFQGPGICALRQGEVLTEVVLPAADPGARGMFLRQERVYMDLAQASVAVVLRAEGDRVVDCRIVAGGVAPMPLRLHSTEAVLRGEVITSETLDRARTTAEAEVRPISDIRATEAYRLHLVGVFVHRAVRTLAFGAVP